MIQYAAFFRNVNLGQPKSPTRAQLESAFANSGAGVPQSFQTNGTLVFWAEDEPTALSMVSSACQELLSVCRLRQPAYLCPIEHLAELVCQDPFAQNKAEVGSEYSASFFPLGVAARLQAPLISAKEDVEVIRITPYVALSISRKVGSSFGSAMALLEKLLSAPVTTRSWHTILRMVKKYS